MQQLKVPGSLCFLDGSVMDIARLTYMEYAGVLTIWNTADNERRIMLRDSKGKVFFAIIHSPICEGSSMIVAASMGISDGMERVAEIQSRLK